MTSKCECLTPGTILRLKRNDPILKNVIVFFRDTCHEFYDNEFDALCGVDWEKEGSCISNNTHLEELCIHDAGVLKSMSLSIDDFKNMLSFFKAVACNTSIVSFDMHDCAPMLGMMFECLAPRFGNGLRQLEITNIDFIAASDVQLFISALERYGSLGSTLEHVGFTCCNHTVPEMSADEAVSQLIWALSKYCKLCKLKLYGENGDGLGNMSIQALTQLLNNPKCVLEDLDLGASCCFLEANTLDSTVLANALASNKKLKRLDLWGNNWFGENGWTQIFQSLQSPSCVLEDLCLKEARNVPSALFGALSNNISLKEIDLSYIEGISTEQWLSLADSLTGMPLEKIYLRGNQETDREDGIVATEINGKVVASFAQLVIDNTSLQELCFGGNHDVGDEVALLFADALTKNSTLTMLGFAPILGYDESTDAEFYRDKITHVVWEAMKLALFDGSSIDATFKSNHVLQNVGDERDWKQNDMKEEEKLPKYLQDLLQLNASDLDKFAVARKKILLTHFNNEHSKSMKIFEEDMDLQVIPHAIVWMMRDKGNTLGQTLFYWMIRSFPSLLSSSEKKKKVASGIKRKLVVE